MYLGRDSGDVLWCLNCKILCTRDVGYAAFSPGDMSWEGCGSWERKFRKREEEVLVKNMGYSKS